MSIVKVVDVNTNSKKYKVFFGNVEDCFPKLGLYSYSKVHIISDSKVSALYGDFLTTTLSKQYSGNIFSYTIPEGEISKSFSQYEKTCTDILENGIDKASIIIAFGGGVVGDLVGFIASTMLRGVQILHIPTTLIAQIDSSIGGKNAINTLFSKNTLGTIYQPVAVINDVRFLKTLPRREFLSGYGEVIKYSFLSGSKDFFDWLDDNYKSFENYDNNFLMKMVIECVKIKADIISRDENDVGERRLLNLGHTIGHALEANTGYNSDVINHGEAVVLGIIIETKLAILEGLCNQKVLDDLIQHYEKVGLLVNLPRYISSVVKVQDVIKSMSFDKKAIKDKIMFALPTDIGKAILYDRYSQINLFRIINDEFAENY